MYSRCPDFVRALLGVRFGAPGGILEWIVRRVPARRSVVGPASAIAHKTKSLTYDLNTFTTTVVTGLVQGSLQAVARGAARVTPDALEIDPEAVCAAWHLGAVMSDHALGPDGYFSVVVSRSQGRLRLLAGGAAPTTSGACTSKAHLFAQVFLERGAS